MTTDNPFANLGFDDFKRLAQDESLSRFERIGFPNAYREGVEEAIFNDIRTKLTHLDKKEQTILDIGPGCSDLPALLIEQCYTQAHQLHLVDSAEMLAHLPDAPSIHKYPALYPNCPELTSSLQGKVDAILCYSVLHYIFVDVSLFRFLDVSLSLLAPGGQFLIGDIPNISHRKRFFASAAGVKFHQQFMQTDEKPTVQFNQIECDQLDDAVIFSILQRARLAGFHAYLLPQPQTLPMSNRREDILIIRP